MADHVFHCPDCGTTSTPLPTPALLAIVTRAHICREVCIHCHWRRPTAGRGLCRACYADPTITINYPDRRGIPSADLLDDWDMLRRDGYTLRQAAERLGITYAALDQALVRAKRRRDPRAVRPGRAA